MRTVKDVSTRLNAILQDQNTIFIERETELEFALIALLSRKNVFYLGKPGLAKSMTVRDTTRRITGANYFEKLIAKDTKTAEIFGPIKLSALKSDRLEHAIDGYLATAHIAFLDEIFKGSSAVNNAFLTIMNERVFHNGNQVVQSPLVSIFSASNELPEGEELGAMYDRFLLRFYVNDLEDKGFRDLLSTEPDLTAPPRETISLEELSMAQAIAGTVAVPDGVKESIVNLRSLLRGHGVEFGPRRWVQGVSVVRAHAALYGRDEASEEDVLVYQHILWDTVDQMKTVGRLIYGHVHEEAEKFYEIFDGVETKYREFKSAVDRNDEAQIAALAPNMTQELLRATKQLEKIEKSAKGDFAVKVKDAQRKFDTYKRTVFHQGLGLSTEV